VRVKAALRWAFALVTARLTALVSYTTIGMGVVMLTEYIERAMGKAVYDKLEDGTYCGKIPECPGTIAFAKSLYQCQNELRSVLEGWLLVKIKHGDHLPIIDGVDLNKGIPVLKETVAHG